MTTTRPTWPAWLRRAVRDNVMTPDAADNLAQNYLHLIPVPSTSSDVSARWRRPARTRSIGTRIGYTIGALITILIAGSVITSVIALIVMVWRWILGG
ncbi:hypothetical protein [Microcella alkaliphila]|uniref:Integral membrane protein, YccS/YhfK family prot ein n=1 Tax=Microcella alkaliphila TaxID=279828 RepID=A0A0U5BVJ0_9MICO|nr:hypothetical protein [Microcella alkaliphila]BAU32477.1 integral membrane protein, YccS/YhfK family prot ein [Microcella alkaliphila]